MCATHGAIYEPDTGKCVGGPCRGGALACRSGRRAGHAGRPRRLLAAGRRPSSRLTIRPDSPLINLNQATHVRSIHSRSESTAATSRVPPPAGEPSWERAALERIALAAINEQRAARRWKIFFRFVFLIVAAAGRLGRVRLHRRQGLEHRAPYGAGRHWMAKSPPNSNASADNINSALRKRVRRRRHGRRDPALQQPGRQSGAGGHHLSRDPAPAREISVEAAVCGGRRHVRVGRLLRRGGGGQDLRRQGEHRRLDRRADGRFRLHRPDGQAGRRSAGCIRRARTRAFSTRSRRKRRRWTRTRRKCSIRSTTQFIDAVKEGRGKRLQGDAGYFLGHVLDGSRRASSWVLPMVSATPITSRAKSSSSRISSITRRRKASASGWRASSARRWAMPPCMR